MRFLEMLDSEIAAQERLLEAHPAYVKLKALRATRAIYVGEADASPPSVDVPRREVAPSERRRPSPMAGKSLDAVSAVVDIRREHGAPIRTAQLMPLIAERGIEFAGKAPQNILSSLLSRSPDVVSLGGHVGWGLKEWETAGSDRLVADAPPAETEPEAQGREAGPGGGT